MQEENTLTLLNEKFEVASYDGGSQDNDDDYAVKNILKADRTPHCSKKGKNFDLLLKTSEKVVITHFMIRGGENCTAPIKSGLIWFYDAEPKIDEYCKTFDDFTKEKFDALADGSAHKPFLFFTTNEATIEFETRLASPQSAKFVHIKFLEPWDDHNIDVGYIGLVGYVNKDASAVDIKSLADSIPESFGITRKKIKAVNDLHVDLRSHINSGTCFLLFTAKADLVNIYRAIAEKHFSKDKENPLVFFHSDSVKKSQFDTSIYQYLSGTEDDGLQEGHDFFFGALNNLQKYHFKHDSGFTAENVEAFVNDLVGGKLTPFFKSAKRPQGDADASHPGLTIVVASSFAELVLNKDKDVFLDVYADWCGPCRVVSPKVANIAAAVKNVDSLVIAKFDCDANDKDRSFLPENSIPTLKLFPAKDVKTPATTVKYEGERSSSAMLKFIHEHATHKFDLDAALKSVEQLDKLEDIKKDVNEATSKLTEDLQEVEEFEDFKTNNNDVIEKVKKYNADFKSEFEKALEVEAKDDNAFAKKQSDLEALGKKFKEDANLQDFNSKLAAYRKEKEKKDLKLVEKVYSDDEFDQAMAAQKATGKLVVVDFFAEWCGPCHFIAPYFADLSEEFKDVVKFVKLDVDVCAASSSKCGIRAMPTFHFYKNGDKVDELVGASKDQLKAKIEKNK